MEHQKNTVLVGTEPTYADPHGFRLQNSTKKPHNPFRDSGAVALIALLEEKIKKNKTMYSFVSKYVQSMAGNQ